MSTTLNQRLFGRDFEFDTTMKFLAAMEAAASVALTPARQLEPNTLRARNVAVSLNNDFTKVSGLVPAVFDERARVESDKNTRADVLQAQWLVAAAGFTTQADELSSSIKTKAGEVREALQDAALPVSNDPAAALIARQDVEARLRSPERGLGVSTTTVATFMELAQRGGDTAAAVASAWGRDTYIAANGDDTSFETIVAAAVATSITSEDPARRKAAAALQALDNPTGDNQTAALYTAIVFSSQVLRRVEGIARINPVIFG
jgi:hypothetical protein